MRLLLISLARLVQPAHDAYGHTYGHVSAHVYAHVHAHVYVHVYRQVHVHAYRYEQAHVYEHSYARVCGPVHAHVHACTYVLEYGHADVQQPSVYRHMSGHFRTFASSFLRTSFSQRTMRLVTALPSRRT